MTNWFDPDAVAGRALVLIGGDAREPADGGRDPEAFGDARAAVRARLRGAAGRSQRVHRRRPPTAAARLHEPFRRILVWSSLIGAAVDRRRRSRRTTRALVLWIVALAIDYAGAARAGYWTPGLGATPTERLDDRGRALRRALPAVRDHRARRVDRRHRRHRVGAEHRPSRSSAALAVAFLGSAALWWLYFDHVAGFAQERLARGATTSGRARPRRLHLPAPADRRGHRAQRGRRRARDRASRADTPLFAAFAIAGGAAVTCSATCCSGSRMARARAGRGSSRWCRGRSSGRPVLGCPADAGGLVAVILGVLVAIETHDAASSAAAPRRP